MNVSGRRILKTTAAVVGISALGALGTGTAFAATPTDLGVAPTSHGTSTADTAGLSSPTSSSADELHSFAAPKMATHVSEPSYRYDDNNDDSDYNDDRNYRSSRYDDNNDYNDDNYNDYNDDNDGYWSNGRYHRYNNDDGLLGGGLLGGND
ncbi:MAG TPA: hypothetical protein VL595_09410 [Pseudonocardia sp.]|jgi:hypothetical protein|nr:hypothetical protein [Pseudonocardia sp.]